MNSKSDFILSYVFSDNSCASICFSSKGEPFEGVRELLVIHKGDLLGKLSDFQKLDLDIKDKKIKYRNIFKDHGHKENIINSFRNKEGRNLNT